MAMVDIEEVKAFCRDTRDRVDGCKFRASAIERAGMTRALRLVELHMNHRAVEITRAEREAREAREAA